MAKKGKGRGRGWWGESARHSAAAGRGTRGSKGAKGRKKAFEAGSKSRVRNLRK